MKIPMTIQVLNAIYALSYKNDKGSTSLSDIVVFISERMNNTIDTDKLKTKIKGAITQIKKRGYVNSCGWGLYAISDCPEAYAKIGIDYSTAVAPEGKSNAEQMDEASIPNEDSQILTLSDLVDPYKLNTSIDDALTSEISIFRKLHVNLQRKIGNKTLYNVIIESIEMG